MATSETCLGVDDLVDVLDLLKRCGFPKANWYELGLRLGLRKSTLDVIEKNHPHDVSRCMTECLSQWLSRADNVDSRGGANLDSLSDALRSMNETAVAEKLKYQVLINIFNNRNTVLSQSLCDSVGIAWLLYGECMLTQEAVSRVVSAIPSIPNQREALLTAVKEAVQTDPNSLHTFANVLCTISTNVSLGQTILDDISKYFPIPELGVVPKTIKDHDVVPQNNTCTANKTKTADSDTYSDTKVASNSFSWPLSPQVEVHVPVPKDLLTNFSSMRTCYGRMFYNVGKIIKRKTPPLEEIKEFLSCRSTVLRRKVEQCTDDISSVLRLIQNECSLTDIELLHSVVQELEITEATRHIEAYRTELKEFCKSLSISLCLKERFASISHLQCETVTLVFDWEPEEHVLQDIKDILSKVSGKLLKIETSTSICVTCSFPFSDVGFTILRMIENIHILMGQGLKKLTIGNLTLWKRQDVRQKELKEKDQDLLQHTDVISYIILEEAECKLRDAISSNEKEIIELKQALSKMKVLEEESLSVQSDTDSIKEVEEESLYEELTVLSSQFNEIKEENKELSDKLSKVKLDYLGSLSSNTDSAASKARRGMSFEIDDCKFHLKTMTRPDYQPLVDNKRIIEKLQERITLMNMELITKREHNEKIIKELEGLNEENFEDEEIAFDSLSDDENFETAKNQISTFFLYCNHPVTGELTQSTLEVDKDELLPSVLDKAYKLMEVATHIPIERCRLVKYYYLYHVMDQSLDLDEFQHQTIGQIMGVAGYYGLFLETHKRNRIFKKYNAGGINLKVSVVDLSTGKVGPAIPMRAEQGWTVGELKQHILEAGVVESVFFLNLPALRLLVLDENAANNIKHLENASSSLKDVFFKGDTFSLFGPHKLLYVSSDRKDYQKEYRDSLMYRYVDFHINSIQLNITIPPAPGPEATPTNELTAAREIERWTREGGIIMNIISMIPTMNEEKMHVKKGKKIKVEVSNTIKLSQLKVKLVPLVGVPSADFRVCRINDNEEYEIKKLDETLKDIESGSELIIRLGRKLQEGEEKIKLYLLQVNNTEFCSFMMESIVTKNTPVREFKKQIIEEAKVQGIDCVLELDKMRLRDKDGVSPGSVYLDHQLINEVLEYLHVNIEMCMYVEPLKGLERKKHSWQKQVYVIRWHPSQCSVDPIKEIILDFDNHIIHELSMLSGVSKKYIFYTELKSFPVEISCLDIENKLIWYHSDIFSSEIHSDGYVIYYKDKREKMKELTDKERSEIQEAEEARLRRIKEYIKVWT